MIARILLVFLAGLTLRAAAQDVATLIAEGDALDKQNKSAKALETFLAAEKLAPKDPEVLYRVSKQYGVSMVDTGSKAEKKALAEKALAYAKKAVEIDPKNAMAQLSLAVCYGRIAPYLDNKTSLGYSKLVKEHAEKALALDPKNDLASYVVGAWHYELASLGTIKRGLAKVLYGQVPPASYEEAARYFSKAIQLNPNRMASHVDLGRALAELGKKEEARQALQRGLAMPNREKDDPEVKLRGQQALKSL